MFFGRSAAKAEAAPDDNGFNHVEFFVLLFAAVSRLSFLLLHWRWKDLDKAPMHAWVSLRLLTQRIGAVDRVETSVGISR